MFIRRENFKQYVTMYPIVTTLLAINIIVYFITLIPGIGRDVIFFGVSFNYLIANGEWWRLITSMFLHGGLMHILFNMFSLFIFGPDLERLVGKGKFLAIYFGAGIGGNIITFLVENLSYSSLGASGAIFGIIGAFGALVYYTRNHFPQLKQIVLPIIVVSVIMTFLSPNINITAHLGGLVVGFLLGLMFFNPKNRKPRAI